MTTLRFKNLVFNTGKNLTVRRGTKWSGAENSQPTEFGYFVRGVNPPLTKNGDEEVAGFADVYKTAVFRFADLYDIAEVLEAEHDPICRNYQGLKEVMESTYEGFSPYEIVTLVWFEWKA